MFDTVKLMWETLPYPDQDCTGKTMIVTGANIGLGKEAARHFVRLNAAKVIISVRSMTKGEEAKADIEATTERTGVVDVWELDLCSYASVKAFAAEFAELRRVDSFLCNASVALTKFSMAEDNETIVTVNVVSTFLLIMLVLPTLRKSAETSGNIPVITVVGSDAHAWTEFKERSAPSIFEKLTDPGAANMTERYQTTKLLQVFAFRELAARLATEEPTIVINQISPGLAKTGLTRHTTGGIKILMSLFHAVFARTAEEGSRTLVHAATCGPESQGKYFSNCRIDLDTSSDFTRSPEGLKTQKRVWEELLAKLEIISPGISNNL